ncbi:MAG TPA: hypothetical protein PKJ41_15305 [Bryobacteraceae bacterium]|nr:hypothetical protein [Bryobacteraceae bacterium]HPT26111.1 hypothetical protein [Bryobacteraceae bacterium]
MQTGTIRWLTLLGAAAIFFGVTVAIGLAIVPEPRASTDFLVIGTISTLVALSAVFVMLISTIYKSGDNFVRRKPKPNELPAEDNEDTPNT